MSDNEYSDSFEDRTIESDLESEINENDSKTITEDENDIVNEDQNEQNNVKDDEITDYVSDGNDYMSNIDNHTIAAGIRYTLGWTDNENLRIGCSDVPSIFDTKGWKDIKSISAIGDVLIGLKGDNTVELAHDGDYTFEDDVSDWSQIVQVAAGDKFALGLTADGNVKWIGRNSEGQLRVDDWVNIKQIAAGRRISVGLDGNGILHFAGKYSEKFESEYNRSKEKWNDVVKIYASGGYEKNDQGHIVGLKTNGDIVCLGEPFKEGSDSFDSEKVEEIISDVRLLALGDYHLVAITNSNQILVIGDAGTINPYKGQDYKEQFKNWPVKDFVDIVAGKNLTIGLTKNGETYASGVEKQGQMLANQWNDIALP